MTLRSNVAHTEATIGKPTEPQMIPLEVTVEDGSGVMMLRQAIATVRDSKGVVCEVAGGGGLGSDLILFTYTHTDGKKRTGGFHLTPVLAAWIEKVDPDADKDLLTTLRGG